ncbi:unnamed protein product [Closterium sp. NIES-54]
MYALTDSAEADCYLRILPDPGIAAVALGASASAAPGTGESAAPGAGESALSDSTTLMPLSRPVAVSLASGGPVLAHSSTVLPCPAAPSGLLSGLHLPSFSTNLVSGADPKDTWVDQFTPGGQRVMSNLYVAASSQVFAAASRSSPASAPCSCRPLSQETLLWHHRLGHPSLSRLRGMASCTLVSGLPWSLPPLPLGPAPTCVPCVEGRQRVAPHSSTFSPTKAPLQTLYIDVWGLARVRGQGHERYFLLVVDDNSRYTTVFPLLSKGEVPEVLIDWIRGARRQLSERFGSDLPVLRLHSDRGGEFSSDLLKAFCRAEGIHQTFTLPASPQRNGIAERRIGMVMDVARTSMIHADAPHFLWPFARTSCPPVPFPASSLASPPDASGWQFYHPTSRRVLSSQDVMFDESVSFYRLFPYCIASLPPSPLFLASGTPPVDPLPPQGPAPSGVSQVHPAEPVEVALDSGAARGAKPVGVGTKGAEPGGAEPERVESGGDEPAGAGTGGAESWGAEPERVEPGGTEHEGTASWGAEPARSESGGSPGVPLRRKPLPSQRLREWYARRYRRATGAAGAGAAGGAAGAGATGGAAGAGAGGGAAGAGAGAGAAGAGAGGGAAGAGASGGAAGAGAAGGAAGAGAAGGAAGAGAAGAAGPRGARNGGTGAAGACGAAGIGAAGTGAGGTTGVVTRDPGAEGTCAVSAVSGGAARPRPYYVPLLQQDLGLPPSPGPTPPLLSPPPVQSQSLLQPASPLPGPSPYSGPTRGLTERHEPESRPVSPESHPPSPESRSESLVRTIRAGHCVSRTRSPHVLGTHSMTLHPSTAPQRVPLPSPPASSLPGGPDPESDSLRAASPTVTRFLATAVTDPLFESTLVAELVDFAAACHLDYATSLVAVSASVSVCPPSVGDPDAPDIPTPRSYAEAIEGPYSSQWQAAMDAEIASWMTLATLCFAPSTADPSLFLRTDTTLPPFYVLVYIDDLVFATADTEALAHVKAQRTITLTQSHMVQQVLQHLGFTYSSPQSTPLPTGHSISAPPSDESVEPSGPYPELVGCLMYLMTCTRPDLAYPLSLLARYVAPGRHRKVHWDAAKRVLRYLCSTSSMGLVLGGRARVVLTGHADASWVDDLATQQSLQGYTFSIGSGSVSWQSTRSSSVLSSSCEAEIYAGAMAAQELRWLTYLLTDLGEAPRSPPVLYVDNKAMLALCQEHRLEHRTKHIALPYFLARELQQHGQLCLAYVASEANTADVFTKALHLRDHQRFCTVLGLVPTVPHLLTS